MSDRLGEALTLYDKSRWELNEPFNLIVAAARLVADARQPDYEAAAKAPMDCDIGKVAEFLSLTEIQSVVAAALGVEPGSRVKVVVIEDD